jgi:hypothetical protein
VEPETTPDVVTATDVEMLAAIREEVDALLGDDTRQLLNADRLHPNECLKLRLEGIDESGELRVHGKTPRRIMPQRAGFRPLTPHQLTAFFRHLAVAAIQRGAVLVDSASGARFGDQRGPRIQQYAV